MIDRRLVLPTALAAAGLLLVPSPGHAVPISVTLEDANSRLVVDLDSQAGIKDWAVQGLALPHPATDHLEREWFWYRVGPTGPEASVDSLFDMMTTAVTVLDTNPLDYIREDFLRVVYRDPGQTFEIDILLILTGGAAGEARSDVADVIKITNLSTTETLNFHFWEYSNFDLKMNAGDDFVDFLNPNAVFQGEGKILSETVMTTPDRRQVATNPTLFNALTDGGTTNLDNLTLQLAGLANYEWAAQWDFNLAPGSAFLISKNKAITPEPFTVLMTSLGLFGLAALGRHLRR